MPNIKKDGSIHQHRGAYTPLHPAPFELSRGKIEMMKQCEACFGWKKWGKAISMPGFNLNTNTDTLLKRDLDQFRGKGPHPIMQAHGYGDLRPFDHADLKNGRPNSVRGESEAL